MHSFEAKLKGFRMVRCSYFFDWCL